MNLSPHSNRNWPKFIPLVFGFGLAVLTIMLRKGQDVTFGDAADYMARAHELLRTGNYSREPFVQTLPFFRVPLYPLFITTTWKLVPNSIIAIKFAHDILFGGTCQILYSIGLLVFKSWPFAHFDHETSFN